MNTITDSIIWIEGIIMEDTYKMILEERARMSKKWNDYFDAGNPFTDEVIQKMKEDDEKLKKMGEEYIKECFKSTQGCNK